MNRFILCLILGLGALLSGCNQPHHTVIDSKTLVVYHKIKCENVSLGQYEYWVRDNSVQGWRFISDQDIAIGTILAIAPAR